MEIKEIGGSSGYQSYLQLALDDAVLAYLETHEVEIRKRNTAQRNPGGWYRTGRN